jgi:hypothetical protein
MDRNMTVGDLVSLLRREIAQRQSLLKELESRLDAAPSARKKGAGLAAVEILRAAGRPMHGLGEILPALHTSGYEINSKAGLPALLLRTGQVRRTAPGTFAYSPGDATGARE